MISPCEYFAGVAYEWIVRRAGDPPSMEADDEGPSFAERRNRWQAEQVLLAVAGDARPRVKRAAKTAAVQATEVQENLKEPRVDLGGLKHIGWHRRMPQLKVWAGLSTLETLVAGRRMAIWDARPGGEGPITAALPAGTRLLDWRVPILGVSGLDPRSECDAIDVGFSPSRLGMPVYQYAAAELLMIIGMDIVPITCVSPWVYEWRDADDAPWQFRVTLNSDGKRKTLGYATQPRLKRY